MSDWKTLVFSSHRDAAVAIREAIERGEVRDAMMGLEELIHSMSRSEERELYSRLALLMAHIFKWQTQPPGSKSWRLTINEQRRQIAKLRRDAPRCTAERLRAMWEECLEEARTLAEEDMDRPPVMQRLSWEEVFEARYDERNATDG